VLDIQGVVDSDELIEEGLIEIQADQVENAAKLTLTSTKGDGAQHSVSSKGVQQEIGINVLEYSPHILEEGGYMIPDQPLKVKGDQDIIRGQMSSGDKEPSSMDKGALKQCIKGVQNSKAVEVTMLDNMSASEGDMVVEGEAKLINTWKPCTKKTSKKGPLCKHPGRAKD
jgi:hypothetical protein